MLFKSNLLVLLFLSIGILLSQSSFAQENYTRGQIITIEKDTMEGWIDYRNWRKNPKKINFKFKKRSAPVTYSALAISEFRVKEEMYIGAIVDHEISSNELTKMDIDSKMRTIRDTVFLQMLIGGTKSLYYYKTPLDKDLFYIKDENEYLLLGYKQYIKNPDGVRSVAKNTTYLAQLGKYLKGCASIASKMQGVKYTQSSLKKLFDTYYDCTDTETTFTKKKEKLKSKFGAVAGLSITATDFTGVQEYNYLIKADFDPSLDFSGGLTWEIILPRNHGKFSIYNELLYSSYSIDYHWLDYTHETSFINHYSTIGLSHLKLNNFFRYSHPVSFGAIFIGGGITNGMVLKETNYRSRETTAGSTTHITATSALRDIRDSAHGFAIGGGIRWNQLSLEARVENAGGLNNYSGFGSLTYKFHFLVGYRLN